MSRSGRGSYSFITQDTVGYKPVHLRGVQQGVPAGAKPSAPPPRPQPAMEASAEEHKGGAAPGLRVPRDDMRPP